MSATAVGALRDVLVWLGSLRPTASRNARAARLSAVLGALEHCEHTRAEQNDDGDHWCPDCGALRYQLADGWRVPTLVNGR